MIDVRCNGCQKHYRVKAQLAGRRLKCKSCGNPIDVPAAVHKTSGGGNDNDWSALLGQLDAKTAPPPAAVEPTPPRKRRKKSKASAAASTAGGVAAAAAPASTAYRAPAFDTSAAFNSSSSNDRQAMPVVAYPFILGQFIAWIVQLSVAGSSEQVTWGQAFTMTFIVMLATIFVGVPIFMIGVHVASKIMKFQLTHSVYIVSFGVLGCPASFSLVGMAFGQRDLAAVLGLVGIVLSYFVFRYGHGLKALESLVGFILSFVIGIPTLIVAAILIMPLVGGVASLTGLEARAKATAEQHKRDAQRFARNTPTRNPTTPAPAEPAGPTEAEIAAWPFILRLDYAFTEGGPSMKQAVLEEAVDRERSPLENEALQRTLSQNWASLLPNNRVTATQLLIQADPVGEAQHIARAIGDPDDGVQSAGLTALGDRALPGVLPALAQLAPERSLALVVMKENYTAAEVQAAMLEVLKESRSSRERLALLGVLEPIATVEAAPTLYAVLDNTRDDATRGRLETLLQRIDPVGMQPINRAIRALSDDDPFNNVEALNGLALAEVDPALQDRVGQVILSRLADAHGSEADAAQAALTTWRSPQTDSQIIEWLGSEDSGLRRIALKHAGIVESPEVIPALAAMLETDSRAAAAALIEIGPDAEEAVWPYLLSDDFSTASQAIEVIAKVGGRRSIPRLISASKLTDSSTIQRGAIKAVRVINARLRTRQP